MFGRKTNHAFEDVIHYKQYEVGPYMEMSQIQLPDTPLLMTLATWGDEGPIAHFHFYRRKGVPKGGNGGGCIMFQDNKYFNHGNHTEVLRPKELKILVEFLKTINSDTKITVWESLIFLWNANNPAYRIDIDTSIPPEEYKKITLYKNDNISKQM